jgi:hypothetical protein
MSRNITEQVEGCLRRFLLMATVALLGRAAVADLDLAQGQMVSQKLSTGLAVRPDCRIRPGIYGCMPQSSFFLKFRKNTFHPTQISPIPLVVPAPNEGRIAIVTKRWVRDAMDAAASGAIVSCWTRALPHTAKSCGPDIPTLMSSLRGDDLIRRWWQESQVHQGEREVSR